MTTSVIIDLVIAGVLLLCLSLGWRRGLFRSLAELAAVIAALVLAAQVSTLAADAVVDKAIRPATVAAVEAKVDELLAAAAEQTVSPREELERALGAIPNDYIRQKAAALLEGIELPAESTGREALLRAAEELVDLVLDTVVRGALHALLFAVVFCLANLLLRLAIRALNLTFRLPLLRQVNCLGGLLFGAAKGLVLVYLGVWLLGQAGILLTPEVIAESTLLRVAAAWAGVTGTPG